MLYLLALLLPLAATAPLAEQQQAQEKPVQGSDRIVRRLDIITQDVVVRDNSGLFVADIKKDEFEIWEDGIKQKLESFVLIHGGRVYNQTLPEPPRQRDGIILPPTRPSNDAAGRIFIIFVDDLHLDFRNTGRIRDLFKRISTELVHEGDMFSVVSTGPSSIEIQPTYDRRRLDEARNKITGGGLKPQEILDAPEGAEGPAELRYRAHVAFSTAYDMLKSLETVHHRRKAFIYISNGYDFNPFETSRNKAIQERYQRLSRGDDSENNSDVNPFNVSNTNKFAEADLVGELSELTRQANRANTTIYTIDPRGLVGGPDLDEKIDMAEYQSYVSATQSSLRTIAELTGGTAVVNQNDFSKALKKIDAETSDYYVLGFYSSNPDPLKKRRKIEVKVTRKGMNVFHRSEYRLRPNDKPK
jgi:VWFA-related protein